MKGPLTPRACVIGWPVRHSRSPLIHGFWLRTLGLPGAYVYAEVAPNAVAGFFQALKAHGFVGGNVTVPHKERAFAACTALTPTARALGAVNTLWFEDGVLHGDNTDVEGFLANLDAGAPGWSAETALVLGAGGASRAILHALRQRGVRHCVLANRTFSRAQDLARHFGDGVDAIEWSELSKALPTADLIVNTTSLGMTNQPALTIDVSACPAHALITDIVYVPLETPFLVAARARGLRTVDGLGMLLHQAVPGFARWFGVQPSVTPALRQVIEDDVLTAGQVFAANRVLANGEA